MRVFLLLGIIIVPLFAAYYPDFYCDDYKFLDASVNRSGYIFQHESCKCRDKDNPTLRKYEIKNKEVLSLPVKWEAGEEVFIEGKLQPGEMVVTHKKGYPVKQGKSTIGFGFRYDEFKEKKVPCFLKDELETGWLPKPRDSFRGFAYPDQETKIVGRFNGGDNENIFLNIYVRSSLYEYKDRDGPRFSMSYLVSAENCGPFRVLRPGESPSSEDRLSINWGLYSDRSLFSRLNEPGFFVDSIPTQEINLAESTSDSASIIDNVRFEIFFRGEKLAALTTTIYAPSPQ